MQHGRDFALELEALDRLRVALVLSCLFGLHVSELLGRRRARVRALTAFACEHVLDVGDLARLVPHELLAHDEQVADADRPRGSDRRRHRGRGRRRGKRSHARHRLHRSGEQRDGARRWRRARGCLPRPVPPSRAPPIRRAERVRDPDPWRRAPRAEAGKRLAASAESIDRSRTAAGMSTRPAAGAGAVGGRATVAAGVRPGVGPAGLCAAGAGGARSRGDADRSRVSSDRSVSIRVLWPGGRRSAASDRLGGVVGFAGGVRGGSTTDTAIATRADASTRPSSRVGESAPSNSSARRISSSRRLETSPSLDSSFARISSSATRSRADRELRRRRDVRRIPAHRRRHHFRGVVDRAR